MFYLSTYNQPLNRWNVSNVTSMQGMFSKNFEFNQPLNRWNVSKVTDMSAMFAGAGDEDFRTKFNQPINTWDVSRVKTMNGMFYSSNFNNSIRDWNVENVRDMNSMFYGSKFNRHSLSDWDVSNVIDFEDMFRDSAMRKEMEWGYMIKPYANITDMFLNSFVPDWYEELVEDRRNLRDELNIGRIYDSDEDDDWEESFIVGLSPTGDVSDDDDWEESDEEESDEESDEEPETTNIAQIAPVQIPSIHFAIPSNATAYDILEMADVNVSEYMQADPDNIVFVSGKSSNPVYYLSTRSQIARQRNEPTFIQFACRAVDKTALIPRVENVDKTVAYMSLRSLYLGDGLVAMGEINYLLQTPEYRAVRVSPDPVRVLPATASQNMLESINDQQRAVSASHCQEGSDAKVYSLSAIQPVPIEYPTVYVLVYTEPFNYVVGLFSTEENAISCKNIVSTNFVKERFPTTHKNSTLLKNTKNRFNKAFLIIPTTHVNPDRPIYVIMDEGDRLLYDVNDPTRYLTNNVIVWKEGQDNIGAESSANFATKCIKQIDPVCRVRP